MLRKPLLKRVQYEPSAIDDTLFGTNKRLCDVVKRRRPDMIWLGHDPAICVVWECDENGGHPGYLKECDASWMTDMHEALTYLYRKNGYVGEGLFPKVVILRWNPHERDPGYHVEMDERMDVVAARINELLTSDLSEYPTERPTVEYYYYHSKCFARIQYVCALPASIHCGKVYECVEP